MSNNNNTIFIQIASYKDPELKPTIQNLLENADNPQNITIGICWQHDSNENLDQYLNNPQFKIIDVNWRESKGVGWARNLVQNLYSNEKYVLQLDSHHRFIKRWDTELIYMFKNLQADGSMKPIITTYAAVYDPENPLIYTDSRPFKMIASEFTSEGILLFHPTEINNYKKLTKPIKARFVSGHFYFTFGIHCLECKYDPNIYFHGEEISLSVRSYTHGYDLFHPHKLILWHNYNRNNRIKHWDDHVNENNVELAWYERDRVSKNIVYDLLTTKKNNEFGFGSVRTLEDYEKYASIDFKLKTFNNNQIY